MSSILETLNLALEYHRQGDLSEAERLYRQVLIAEPANVDALHLLGIVSSGLGNYELAVRCIRPAIAQTITSLPVLSDTGSEVANRHKPWRFSRVAASGAAAGYIQR